MFSIIICTYNGTRTLRTVIDKVLSQNEYDKYIEQFIIVDNASTDETAKLIKSYGSNSGITYSYESRSGLARAGIKNLG